MEDKLKQLSQAVLAGIQGGDRNAGSSNGAVNQFVQGLFGDVLAKPAAGVGDYAGEVANQQAKEAEAARQAQIKALQDKMDPSKYTVRRKDDGGFDFFDPDGKPIDISEYAKVTGVRPADILSKSENPFDMQYVNDYNNTHDVVDAIQNGDQATLQTYLKENKGINPKSTAQDIMQDLIKKYPHIYGHANYGTSFANSNNKPLFGVNGGGVSSGGGGGGWSPS